MIPLRDDVPSRTVPFVNYALIVLNSLCFLAEVAMGDQLESFLRVAAVVPAQFTGPDHILGLGDVVGTLFSPPHQIRILLAMFLHGGLLHLLGNMLYLWIFGDNVEDRMGHTRYLFFYLLCGWTASYAHIWSNPASRIPSLGASGAIAGVLAAYLTLYPQARVVAVVPLVFFFPLIQLPAVVFLGFWFLQQFLLGTLSLGEGPAAAGSVAFWAHIGGFLTGLALVRLFARHDRRPTDRDFWWDDHPMRRRGW